MQEFDVLIVGAGIAGASLAWRLAARRKVLLIERVDARAVVADLLAQLKLNVDPERPR